MELEQQAFVVAMGVDKAPHGMVDCSFLIAMPVSTMSGGGNGGKQPKAGDGPITFRARTVTDAIQLANSSVERTVTLSHLSLVIFGSSLAKAGLSAQIRPMVRFREFRRTTFLSVSHGSAREILEENKPILEKSSSRWADDIAEVGDRSSLIPVAHLHDFLRDLEDEHEDSVLPLCALNAAATEQSGGSANLGPVTYQAGKIARSGGNPVEWAGAAVFHQDKMVDQLSGRQVMDLRMLQGRLTRAKYSFADPDDRAKSVEMRIRRERKPRYTVALSQPMRVSIVVPIEADLISTEASTDYEQPGAQAKLEKATARQLSDELGRMLIHLARDDGVDVVPMSRYARGMFLTHQDFAAFPWEKRLHSAQIQVHVQLHIRRFGIQAQPVHPA